MVDGGDIAGTTTSTYQQTSIFYIDDVLIEEQPACPSPKIIVASNVTTNGCDLTWASYNATSWEMKISKNAMTDMTANANVFNGTVNSNPYALTGLSPNMTYFIYLRSNCGTDGYSEWSQAATVDRKSGV